MFVTAVFYLYSVSRQLPFCHNKKRSSAAFTSSVLTLSFPLAVSSKLAPAKQQNFSSTFECLFNIACPSLTSAPNADTTSVSGLMLSLTRVHIDGNKIFLFQVRYIKEGKQSIISANFLKTNLAFQDILNVPTLFFTMWTTANHVRKRTLSTDWMWTRPKKSS